MTDITKTLEIRGLHVNYKTRQGDVKAVNNVDLNLEPGEKFGLVGESGSGKSTLGKAIINVLKLTAPDVRINGEIFLLHDNIPIDLLKLNSKDMVSYRSNIQMIFQDPYESLNPRWTIKDIILEPLNIHNIGSLGDREEAVREILTTVGLTPAENYMPRYPHELSGGQRQRVSIARTLIMKPKFVVCDEPTSMLDVSIRISIMDLMLNLAKDLKKKL